MSVETKFTPADIAATQWTYEGKPVVVLQEATFDGVTTTYRENVPAVVREVRRGTNHTQPLETLGDLEGEFILPGTKAESGEMKLYNYPPRYDPEAIAAHQTEQTVNASRNRAAVYEQMLSQQAARRNGGNGK